VLVLMIFWGKILNKIKNKPDLLTFLKYGFKRKGKQAFRRLCTL